MAVRSACLPHAVRGGRCAEGGSGRRLILQHVFQRPHALDRISSVFICIAAHLEYLNEQIFLLGGGPVSLVRVWQGGVSGLPCPAPRGETNTPLQDLQEVCGGPRSPLWSARGLYLGQKYVALQKYFTPRVRWPRRAGTDSALQWGLYSRGYTASLSSRSRRASGGGGCFH